MKKFFITIIATLYLIPAVGITMSAHSCSNELASVSHSYKENKDHVCGKEETKKSCCEDKQFSFKLKDSQQQTELFSQKFVAPFLLQLIPDSFFITPYLVINTNEVSHYLFHPPNLFQEPLYLIHQVFRI